jgi:hypothetical protein
MIAAVLAVHFNASDSHHMREIAYVLIAVAGLLFVTGTVPLAGRGGRSLGGIALLVAGILLFAASYWGTG